MMQTEIVYTDDDDFEESFRTRTLSIIHPDDLENDTNEFQPSPPKISRHKNTFTPGQFLYIDDIYIRQMLVTAWNAITKINKWEYMTENQYSCMLSTDPIIMLIYKTIEKLGYTGHSSYSFAWTIRQMQYIAIHGEDMYMLNHNNYNAV
jgi:hypothetical protein